MATIDLVLLVPILIGAFQGYRKGLLIEILGVLAFIAAVVIGFKFLSLGSSFLESVLGKDTLHFISPYLSFFIIFIPAIFLFRKVSAMLRKAVRLTFLGVLDGILGAVLGGVTAMFGISLLIWIAGKIGITFPETSIAQSQFYPYVSSFAPDIISKISDLLPGGNWLEYLKGLKEKIAD